MPSPIRSLRGLLLLPFLCAPLASTGCYLDGVDGYDDDDDESSSSSSGGVIASCRDQWVCTEITSGDASAFKRQCESGGDQGSSDPCPSDYKGGPTCMSANFKSGGTMIDGNFYWRPTFCANNRNIDTKTTCTADLKGTASGPHCVAPR